MLYALTVSWCVGAAAGERMQLLIMVMRSSACGITWLWLLLLLHSSSGAACLAERQPILRALQRANPFELINFALMLRRLRFLRI